MMHKEIVSRKKAPTIVITLSIILIFLYAYEGLQLLRIRDAGINNTIIFILSSLVIAFIIGEYFNCIISYKYALIADKLIINKRFHKEEKTMASVKISDIVLVTKSNKEIKMYKAKNIGNFSLKFPFTSCYTLVYKYNNEYYKFKFKPSSSFIEKIIKKNPNVKVT